MGNKYLQKRPPELSVVMSVYNGEKYLEESIKSILEQRFQDFEFIIVNDGSTDETKGIIDSFAARDQRIVPVHQKNIGLTKSLNKGIGKAQGKYIARQDGDDVSYSDRFEKQMNFLHSHPDVVLCGTWFLEVNENKGSKIRKYPVRDRELKENIKYINHFCHPSVIFSKDAFVRAGGYDETFITAQDFELWIRMAKTGNVANVPEVLVKKRIGFENTVSWQKRKQKVRVVKDIISQHFNSWCEIDMVKFVRYYSPMLIYGFIPVPMLRIIRKIRYR